MLSRSFANSSCLNDGMRDCISVSIFIFDSGCSTRELPFSVVAGFSVNGTAP
jgi:hypothetical protein